MDYVKCKHIFDNNKRNGTWKNKKLQALREFYIWLNPKKNPYGYRRDKRSIKSLEQNHIKYLTFNKFCTQCNFAVCLSFEASVFSLNFIGHNPTMSRTQM